MQMCVTVDRLANSTQASFAAVQRDANRHNFDTAKERDGSCLKVGADFVETCCPFYNKMVKLYRNETEVVSNLGRVI